MNHQRYQHWATMLIALSLLYTPITIGEQGNTTDSATDSKHHKFKINLPDIKKMRSKHVEHLRQKQQTASESNNTVANANTSATTASTTTAAQVDESAGTESLPSSNSPNSPSNSPSNSPANATSQSLQAPQAGARDNNARATMQDNRDASNNNQIWNLKDVDIRTVISRVSRETGRNFVIDPRVQGKVTLVSQHVLKPEELYQVFLAMLQVNGFSAVETDGAVRIIREQDLRSLAGPVTDFPKLHHEDENIVKVIHVEHVPVKDMLNVVKPLLPKTAYFSVYSPSNDVIISDRAANVARVADVIDQLDKPWTEGAEIIRLRHASPTEIVNLIEGMRGNARARDEAPLSLAADDRTNSIIMTGPASKRLSMRALIARLDVESEYDGNLHVVYLKFTRASDIAPILANIIDSYETQQNKQTSSSNVNAYNPVNRGGINRADNLGAFNRSSTTMSSSYGGTSGGANRLGDLEGQSQQFFQSDDRQKSGGSGAVQWEDTTNAVIIKASPPIMKILRNVIAKLDIRRPQVLVETIIAEVDVDQVKNLGVEWNTGGDVRLRTKFPDVGLTSILGPLGGVGFAGTGALADTTSTSASTGTGITTNADFGIGDGLTLGFFHHGNLRALVRAIQGDLRNNVLATPNIITLDNETANIKVGEVVPFQTGETTNNNGTSVGFNREEVGLSLTLRPQITQSGAIKLQIQHILSNVVEGSAATNPGGNPTTNERVITTNVVVDNGETLVLGGLIRSDWIKSSDKVPVLGDLPLVGKAFRSDSKRSVKRNLMIFIRPVILRDSNDNVEVTTGKYNHIRQLQLESYRQVPEWDESPALEQIGAPKPLPAPMDLEQSNYKQAAAEKATASESTYAELPAPTIIADDASATKSSHHNVKRRHGFYH